MKNSDTLFFGIKNIALGTLRWSRSFALASGILAFFVNISFYDNTSPLNNNIGAMVLDSAGWGMFFGYQLYSGMMVDDLDPDFRDETYISLGALKETVGIEEVFETPNNLIRPV